VRRELVAGMVVAETCNVWAEVQPRSVGCDTEPSLQEHGLQFGMK
jgi:hypothetical protein